MPDLTPVISISKIAVTVAAVGPQGATGSPGSGATKESLLNKRMQALTATSDGSLAVAVAVLGQPVAGYVGVRINGVDVPEIGDGTTTNCACYFSADSGVHARAWGAIAQGDTLYWVPSIAGFSLSTSDVVDFMYEETLA